jgi:Protein of unknown function (DUF2809)
MKPAQTVPRRPLSRWKYALLATGTVVAGLLSRAVHTGLYLADKSLGDALYAALIYWCLAFALRGQRPTRLAIAAGAFCAAIEAFKFTGLPQAWSASIASRLVFGTTPSLHNLLCYAAGIGLAAWLDFRLRATVAVPQ